MAFKAKNKSRLNINTKQTIDAKHQDIIDEFKNKSNSIPELESEIESLKTQINDLRIESNKNLIIDLEFENKIWNLEEKKKELEENIASLKKNEEENKYMLKTSKILSEYYKVQENEKNSSNKTTEYYVTNNSGKKKTVMDWFSFHKDEANDDLADKKDKNIKSKNKKNENQNTTRKISKNNNILGNLNKVNNNNNDNNNSNDDNNNSNSNDDNNNSNSNDNNEITKQENTQKSKSKLYNDYMKSIDKNFIIEINDEDSNINSCVKCHVEMLLNQNAGILICPKCGIVENIIINSDKPSYKDPPKEQTSFCYKRINHLNEFLAQFQAKETTEIPDEIYNEILVEIKKERIENMAEITPDKMRLILRKIKRNDYYEHIPYIINQLNGLPAPVIAPEIEEIIRNMFKSIQIPFVKYCPNNRKNFLSYNYVVYKFFELLELDEYLNCFQLLKSRTKLHQQDVIWKNICKELNWQFIPSL